MKKIIIIIIVLQLVFVKIFGQILDLETYHRKANLIASDYASEGLFKTIYFSDIHYTVYETPLDLPKPEKQIYSTKCHESPQELIRSLRYSNSKQWVSKLYKNSELNWNDSIAAYQSSEQYRNEYLVRVISELHFKYEGADYCALLVYSRNNAKMLGVNVFDCKKINGKWYFSGWNSQEECDNVTQFTGLLYLKPEYLRAVLYEGTDKHQAVIKPFLNNSAYQDFKNKFFQQNIINSIPMSFGTYWDFSVKQYMPEITLNKGDLYDPSFGIDEAVPKKIAIRVHWSFMGIQFCDMGLNNEENNFKFSGFKADYTEASKAFVSWQFSSSAKEKQNNYISTKHGADSLLKSFRLLDKLDKSTWSIQVQKQIVFDDSKYIYSLVFFNETKVGVASRLKSQLMRFQDASWKALDLNILDMTTKELVTVLDTLEFDVLTPGFTDSKAKNSRLERLAKDRFKGAYGDIYVNEIYERYKYDYPFIGIPAKYKPSDFRSR